MDAAAYEKVVTIASCGSRWDADLKRALLDAEGYRVRIASDDAGGLHPELAFLSCAYRLVVPEAEADSARELLDAIAAEPAWTADEPAPTRRSSRTFGLLTASLLVLVVLYRAWAIINSG